MKIAVRASMIVACAGLCAPAMAQLPVPATSTNTASTASTPYTLPSRPDLGTRVLSFATTATNEFFTRTSTGANDYRLVVIPDGMGAFRSEQDIIDGTFTLLVNHELGDSAGIVRRHGSRGAFVSEWKVRTNDLTVVSADDLITNANLWNIGTGSFQNFGPGNTMPDYAQNNTNGVQGWAASNPNNDGFNRFCSADLAPTSAFSWNGLGTTDRIFMNGEESGSQGRAFAHVASGAEKGTTYELPFLGDFSWEQSIASPLSQLKTVVLGSDDSGTGGIYMYVGDKKASGNVIEKAGLNDGRLYGLTIADPARNGSNQPVESQQFGLGNSTVGYKDSVPFGFYEFSDPVGTPGSTVTPVVGPAVTGVQQLGDANNVLNFLRPEDMAWDTKNPNRAYFVTTDTFGGRARIYAMDYNDVTQPELGGTLNLLGDGGQTSTFSGGFVSNTGATTGEMFDNFCVTKQGYLLIQEDVGSNIRLGRTWLYDPYGDNMVEVLINDAARFAPAVAPFNTDEEASGIIDAQDILGEGWFLFNMQAHYGITGELVQGGQLLAVYIDFSRVPAPGTAAAFGLVALAGLRRRRN